MNDYTFSIGFSEKSYDESSHASLVARHLGTEHRVKICSSVDALNLIEPIYSKLDEPFSDASLLPTHLLSDFAREGVTVALGGDGSDELLAGYPTFYADMFVPFYHRLPDVIKRFVHWGAERLPINDRNISFDFKVNQFLRGADTDRRYATTLWLGSFTSSEKLALLNSSVLQNITNGDGVSAVDYWMSQLPQNTDVFNQLLYNYYRTYLQDDILYKVDRASMFSSLEVRAPFLDVKLVEFISSLDKSLKMKGRNGKILLKELMRGKLPPEIINRPKKGFGIPLSNWLRHDLRKLSDDLLSEPELNKHQLFNSSYIQQLKQKHYDLKQNNRKLLWNLMVFQMWYANTHY